jgi:hypothetical protein
LYFKDTKYKQKTNKTKHKKLEDKALYQKNKNKHTIKTICSFKKVSANIAIH